MSGQTLARTSSSGSTHLCCMANAPPQSFLCCPLQTAESTRPAPPSEKRYCQSKASPFPSHAPHPDLPGDSASISAQVLGASVRMKPGPDDAARGFSSTTPLPQPASHLHQPIRAHSPAQPHLSPRSQPPDPNLPHPAERGRMW